jgi:uncharacterized membrane protein YqhA
VSDPVDGAEGTGASGEAGRPPGTAPAAENGTAEDSARDDLDEVGLPGPIRPGIERALLGSRLLALIPVVVLVFATAGAFVYDAALFIHTIVDTVHSPFPEDGKAGTLLAVIDLFLVGATTLIAAIGFYELYIGVSPRTRARLPNWLVMHDLDDLKARVVSMLILVAAAAFVDGVVNFHGGKDILYYGVAVGVVIAALTAYLRFGGHR